ncbi:MBL fold metallo-hydrolase [Terriglobus saanensis]|uniref:Metallo-beta-lactamase family protein n=1 Tax=Terriglobus saanensis (strain ATCC BAA-1853 / DSM 23119 / SP1PR4) TaxID=401053 RepID=E8V7F3_TERSS|nr:MBL fold metallo-hydrolase [Terriglobus saanensis]ADV83927.1 metallo-beta-lactamase family protein [Terriglobus saanensis SP1PR4]
MPRQHPPIVNKLLQLWNVVRESHRQPIAGTQQKPRLVSAEEVGATFIGHSSFLLQIGGKNVLIDPVFSRYLILLRRQRHPGLRIQDLPPIDAVLLTHAHMDHLNLPSLRKIIRRTKRLTGHPPEAIVPRNVSDLVAKLGFRKITELEWWQDTVVEESEVTVTMTPCKHWGARMFSDTHRHFGGYVLATATQSIYHSGDTAYFSGFREIGRRLHPQTALLPIGAYSPDSYRAVHTSPEEALQAFQDLGSAATFIPMHFGTFPLGQEPMEEPPLRLLAAARKAGIEDQIVVLQEGDTARLIASPVIQPV